MSHRAKTIRKPFELYLNSIELINSNNNLIKTIPFDNSLNWIELPTSEGFDYYNKL